MKTFEGRWLSTTVGAYYGNKEVSGRECLKCRKKFKSLRFHLCKRCRRENQTYGKFGGLGLKVHMDRNF